MYLVIRKSKKSPRAKTSEQTTLSFPNFEALSLHILREGMENCQVFKAQKINFTLKELSEESEATDVSE